ncbi:MAG: hypothetical protein GEU82_08460 [Luteitalea sp.]|nr:hypothetical protein [Luteitalea sp.]
MLNYTALLTRLMGDIAARVPPLSFIDMADVLVFARLGRTWASGPLATCHCLTLPPSERGYYFWRDRASGAITRRSAPFVMKSPEVTIAGRPVKYLISVALPRFCDQSLAHSRKARFYRRAEDLWIAKLDTVVHELYHIAPNWDGIRRIERGDGTFLAEYHGGRFLEEVAEMVGVYLDSKPDPLTYGFLRHTFDTLETGFGGIVGTSFRPFPCYPQRYRETVHDLEDEDLPDIKVERSPCCRKVRFTDRDLVLRRFLSDTTQSANGPVAFSTDDAFVTWVSGSPALQEAHPQRADAPARRAEDVAR